MTGKEIKNVTASVLAKLRNTTKSSGEILEKELRERLRKHLGARLNTRGWLLYSGLDTLASGHYYFLGFNPAKDPANVPLDSVPIPDENWSAYTQQCWRCEKAHCRCEPIRFNPHQRRVTDFMMQLWPLSPERIFSTNAIFVESETVLTLSDREMLWDDCWPIHEWMLSIVRPKWIVCLGNQEDASSYSLLRGRCGSCIPLGDYTDFRKGKVFKGSLPISKHESLDVHVLGLPHPSRFDLPAAASIPGFLNGLTANQVTVQVRGMRRRDFPNRFMRLLTMRTNYRASLAVIILGCVSASSWSASFDCSSVALTTIERTICANDVLSALDSELASNYSARRSQAAEAEKARLVSEQKEWIAQRNQCASTDCLLAEYEKRVEELASAPEKSYQEPLPSVPSPEKDESIETAPETANRSLGESADPRAQISSIPNSSDDSASSDTNTKAQLAAKAPAAVADTPQGNRFYLSVTTWMWIGLAGVILFLCILSPKFRRGFLRGLTSGRFAGGSGGDQRGTSGAKTLYCVYEVSQTSLLNRSTSASTNMAHAIGWAKRLKAQDPELTFVVCECASFNSEPGATVFSI
jgi:uncharacterized protein